MEEAAFLPTFFPHCDYAHSAYGATILRPSIAPASVAGSRHTNKSDLSSIAAKRADTAGQLAAQKAELQAIDEQEPQRATLEQEIKQLDHGAYNQGSLARHTKADKGCSRNYPGGTAFF